MSYHLLNLCLAHGAALAKMSEAENQNPRPRTPTSYVILGFSGVCQILLTW